jgi:hypothetical protein
MHWSDGLKTEEELRRALRGLDKKGVLQDGATLRVPMMLRDGATSQSASWLDADTPQFVKDTVGMSLRDVASAVARQPMPVDIPDSSLKREALQRRFGDGVATLTDEEAEASFITLVATSAGDIARFKANKEMSNAWRRT